MPNYEFRCNKCNVVWDDIVPYDETNKYSGLFCPECGSKEKTKLVSNVAPPVFANPRGTSKEDNFSYKAGYNMEQAKDLRRRAEAATDNKMPYKTIDDITSGKNEF